MKDLEAGVELDLGGLVDLDAAIELEIRFQEDLRDEKPDQLVEVEFGLGTESGVQVGRRSLNTGSAQPVVGSLRALH